MMLSFKSRDAAFAAVWLVFLLPVLVQVLFQPTHSAAQRIWAIAITAVFCVAYTLAFGTLHFYPQGWSYRRRVTTWWLILALLALAAIPSHGVWAVVFVPYLGALVSFTQPLKTATTIIALTGIVLSIPLWLYAEQRFIEFALILFGWPLLILMLGTLSQREDIETALRHDLELAQQREDIASDIHDLLGHTLTAINLKSEVARRFIDRDPSQAAAELEEISALSRMSLAEVRSTVTRMKNPTFTGELQAARRILETAEIKTHLPDPLSQPKSHEELFSWALRELTTNVVRHSGASECWVNLTESSLQVTDNGRGFTEDATHALAAGLTGLAGLRRRAADAGGDVIVRRADGLTTVLLTLQGAPDIKDPHQS
ncbi:two-component sensor histidine kinase [Corynebacterium sp. HMSC074C01]|uniref:sensor histidine kinase n=1 Tax=unclassified Corynebacterium TaxID=2624378 RepID=UPI0008A5C8BD|nr:MULTISPECIES: sensor histidine kinase [unclassified Corynebacterium]OFP64633.1 two-component sensor histidine kinase [Corynebacterium sp. HMSC074C01]OHO61449.1 two-component sensor histidine kinase [Corynebacterium sp. HMSC036D02]